MDQGRQERHQLDAAILPGFRANAVRLRLHTLAYNLANVLRTPTQPATGEPCPERADHAQSERKTAAPAAQCAIEAVVASATSTEPSELTVIAREF